MNDNRILVVDDEEDLCEILQFIYKSLPQMTEIYNFLVVTKDLFYPVCIYDGILQQSN